MRGQKTLMKFALKNEGLHCKHDSYSCYSTLLNLICTACEYSLEAS